MERAGSNFILCIKKSPSLMRSFYTRRPGGVLLDFQQLHLLLVGERRNLVGRQVAAYQLIVARAIVTAEHCEVVAPLPLELAEEFRRCGAVLDELLFYVGVAELACIRRQEFLMRAQDVAV